MVKKQKIVVYSLLALLAFSLVGMASAQEVTQVDDEYNFFTDFYHTLQDLGLFSASGQARDCDDNAAYTVTIPAYGTVYNTELLANCPNGVALYDVFTTSWQYLAEYKSEITGNGLTVGSTSRIVEVYCCPYEACNSDADCVGVSEGDYCNENYGSCYGEAPSYVTQILKCQNDQWMQYGTASYGEDNFCSEGLNNYIDRNGGEHCVLSSYPSVNDGTWCGSYAEPDCTTGQTKCEGQVYYTCSAGDWMNEGNVEGECGYTSGTGTGGGETTLSGEIKDVQLFKNTFQPGEEVEVRLRATNNGPAGDYLIEVGIIPKQTATDWGFVSDSGLFALFNFGEENTECCSGQPNIFAITQNFDEGEMHEIVIKIPKAPYDGISDLCYDNNYWDGEGEYVLYSVMKTGCFPDGEVITSETRLLGITTTEVPDIGDKQIGDSCSSDVECESLHCDDEGIFQIADVCQPTPWSKLKKVAQPKSEIEDMTTLDKMSLLCTSDSECIVIDDEEFKADCISIAKLRDEGLITESNKDFWDYTDNLFYGTGGGAVIGGGLGFGACVGAGAVIGIVFPPAAPAVIAAGPSICAATFAGGAVIGAYEGTQLAFKLDSESGLADALDNADDSSAGLCIQSSRTGLQFAEYTSWAALFDITGDKGVDGLIIILIGLAAGLLVLRK